MEQYNLKIPKYHYRSWTAHKEPVLHQRTCPYCGRTLVNVYRRNGLWKCRKCLDEYDNNMDAFLYEKTQD